MREKVIEKKLTIAVREKGGIALKVSCPSFAGMPDRMVLLPGGHIGFVELKAPGKKPRPLQRERMEMLARLGFQAFVLDDPEQVPAVVYAIGGGGET